MSSTFVDANKDNGFQKGEAATALAMIERHRRP